MKRKGWCGCHASGEEERAFGESRHAHPLPEQWGRPHERGLVGGIIDQVVVPPSPLSLPADLSKTQSTQMWCKLIGSPAS